MTGKEKAQALFEGGYNCAQSVLGAFCTELGLTEQQALALAAPFGGGIGRTRETCGALSGLLMVYGCVSGGEDTEKKAEMYEKTRALMDAFKAQAGSVFCRELLGLPQGAGGGAPEKRTPAYYAGRPCTYLVGLAAELAEKALAENARRQ